MWVIENICSQIHITFYHKSLFLKLFFNFQSNGMKMITTSWYGLASTTNKVDKGTVSKYFLLRENTWSANIYVFDKFWVRTRTIKTLDSREQRKMYLKIVLDTEKQLSLLINISAQLCKDFKVMLNRIWPIF